jgi:uncharacterized membrane protein
MYQLSVFIHIIAACVWVGGQLFMALVVVPALRGWTGPERGRAFSALGRQFRLVGYVALGALVLTGIYNAGQRGVAWSTLANARFYDSEFGQVLTTKVALVVLVFLLSLVHDLKLGPASVKLLNQSEPANEALLRAYRKRASMLARLTMMLSLAIVFLAVALVRGLPW